MPVASISSVSKMSSSFSGMLTFDIISTVSRRQLMSMSDREMAMISTAVKLEVMKNPKIREILAEKVQEILKDM